MYLYNSVDILNVVKRYINISYVICYNKINKMLYFSLAKNLFLLVCC